MIFNFVKPAAVQNWIAANAPGSLKQTPRDSWRAYLVAQGATGSSIGELERTFLNASAGGTLYDKFQTYLAANGGTGGGRNGFQSKFK